MGVLLLHLLGERGSLDLSVHVCDQIESRGDSIQDDRLPNQPSQIHADSLLLMVAIQVLPAHLYILSGTEKKTRYFAHNARHFLMSLRFHLHRNNHVVRFPSNHLRKNLSNWGNIWLRKVFSFGNESVPILHVRAYHLVHKKKRLCSGRRWAETKPAREEKKNTNCHVHNNRPIQQTPFSSRGLKGSPCYAIRIIATLTYKVPLGEELGSSS